MIIQRHRGPRRSRGAFFRFWVRKGSSLFAVVCIFLLVVFSFRSNPSSTDLTHFEQNLRTQKAETIDTANKRFRLFQVINTFATNKDRADEKALVHQPYDQWSTLLSIRRAKQNLPSNLEVTLICAMFESDVRVLKTELNNTCDQMVTLTRSTRTEYGLSNLILNATTENSATAITQEEAQFAEVFHARELPFIQDLINSAVEAGRNTEMQQPDDDGDIEFYVMLTNSDIGLTKNFYSTLVTLLEKGAKAYSINRWSIPMEGENHPITIREATSDVNEANKLLSQIDVALEKGRTHPGHDCFIMHSSIVDKVQLGNMYAAYPPWGVALFRILRDIVARGHYHKTRSSPIGTFHLGGQGTWSKQKTDPKQLAVLEYVEETYKADIHDCPKSILIGDPYTHLNAANCGKVFREVYNRTLRPPIEERRERQRQRQRQRKGPKQGRERRAKRQG